MIKTVIKIGGSLAQTNALPELTKQISSLGKTHDILVVPGGGMFADAVRTYDHSFGLGDDASHWMGIKAMDMMGQMLTVISSGLFLTSSLDEACRLAQKGGVPVLECFELLVRTDELPHSWDVTSDSIAAWLACKVGAEQLILLKSVDRLSGPGAKFGAIGAEVKFEMDPDQLTLCQEVDRYFASGLKGSGLDVWVVNGRHPERLARLFETGATLGTHIGRSGC